MEYQIYEEEIKRVDLTGRLGWTVMVMYSLGPLFQIHLYGKTRTSNYPHISTYTNREAAEDKYNQMIELDKC